LTVHHTVLLNFKQDVSEQQIADFADAVQTYLTASVPGVTQSHFSRRRTPRNHGDATLPFTHMLMTDTPDEAAWQRYIDAPLHDEFVVKYFRPLVRHYQVAIYLEE
jgi:hypothetical protein